MSRQPDIEFEATVRSRRLRFGERPETSLTFHGSPGNRAGSTTERRNLPEEVEPGVTYRDAWVRLRIEARLADELPEDGV